MYATFNGATSFDQNLSSWNVSNVTNMTSMFTNVTLSTQNYDALLIAWSSQSLQNNVTFNGGNSIYSNSSASARQTLTDTFNWTITDGGHSISSKLFVNGQENNTSFGATLENNSKLEGLDLIFVPAINLTQGSSFTATFTNGGFEDVNTISLCSQNYPVGTMFSKGDSYNVEDGVLVDAKFQFNTDVNESLIQTDSNITIHEGADCNAPHPAIVTESSVNSVIELKFNNGLTSSALSIPDLDTNTVTIATIISSIFTTIGSDSSALQTPNGGETWVYDSNETISWNSGTIDGATVDLYILHDDPSNLNEFSSTSADLLNSKTWYQFESNLLNRGSYTINPRDLNGEGDAYIILIIDSIGAWDISDNTFTLINNSPSFILKKTGQTKSYDTEGTEVLDNTLKDDGFYQKGADTNYTRDNANETVTDHLTGLMWQDDPAVASVKKQWVTQANYDAQDYNNTVGDTATTYCNELVMGGFEDWRLPTVVELQGILNDGRYEPSIDEVFINTYNNFYWSSSTSHQSGHNNAWVVNFGYGYTFDDYKYYSTYVRCVRAGQ
jgi:surface protein